MFWFEQKFFFCCFLREISNHNERPNNLNSPFIWLAFLFRVMQAFEAETGRLWDIPLRTLHQKWSQLFYVSNQNHDENEIKSQQQKNKIMKKKSFWNWKTCNRKCKKWKGEKIIGTIFKVNQNQITSKFLNLNHSMVRFFQFFISFFHLMWFRMCVCNVWRYSKHTEPNDFVEQKFFQCKNQ